MKIKASLLLILALLFSLAAPCAALAAEPEAAEGGYIVKLKETADTVRLMSASPLDAISADNGLYKAQSLEEIKALGSAVEYFEPNATARLLALPADPYAKRQWSLESLGMEQVWSKGYNGEGVRVAIIDSGVNSLHEDFEGVAFDKGKNMLDGSRDVTDEVGHGTFVAGIIAAAANNNVGIAGLCDGVTLVPLKGFSDGEETGADYIIRAVYEAVDVLDCDVINLSLGMDSDMRTMKAAVEHAREKGVIVISAVGNSGGTKLQFPAAYDSVVGVGSVDRNGTVLEFSQKNKSVFVTAPGAEIVSLNYANNNTYVIGEGTSYSAPHVTAAAILLKQYAPSADTEDFMQLLELSCHDAGETGYDTSYGCGILDIEDFVGAMESYSFASVEEKYPDVAGHWAAESIEFCVKQKLFNGVSETDFAPDATMTRAMFVTVLGRMSGEKIEGFPLDFSDVSSSDWFAQSTAWGKATGIVTGTSETAFSPNLSVTREQMAALLHRFAKAYGLHARNASRVSLSDYPDGELVSQWAQTDMQWAIANGLITGRTEGTLAPQDSAKRCEVAAIISRFISTFGTPEV